MKYIQTQSGIKIYFDNKIKKYTADGRTFEKISEVYDYCLGIHRENKEKNRQEKLQELIK